MPELPEVETVRRALAPALEGRKIVKVILHREGLRVPFSPRMKQKLAGRRIIACRRRAKYLLLDLDNSDVLLMHLGMSGQIFLVHPGSDRKAARHDHFVLVFDNGLQLAFNDARRFGIVLLLSADEAGKYAAFEKLGPEPLEASFTGKKLAQSLLGRKTSIKAALMDQRIVAGLGNIYVSEALFHAGISPLRAAGKVGPEEAVKLVSAIRKVLKAALAAGGSTLKDYRKADGELGAFQHRFAVYDRAGRPCPGCTCDVSKTGGISRLIQAGRSTFYCPRKQK